MKRNAQRSMHDGGFTLMEVLVAGVIMTISFVLVMQLFAKGQRLSKDSCNYTRAIVHAKDKMEEISPDPETDSGEFEDGFTWVALVELFSTPEKNGEPSLFSLISIKVKVLWDDNNKTHSVELVRLKTVRTEEIL
jgi:general secretion pathway protein I